MPYECIVTTTHRVYMGNVFIPEVNCPVPVRVSGDLICERVNAPEVVVENGSLLCPVISTNRLHADILAVYDTTKPAILPPTWTCRWLRPMVPGLITPYVGMPNAESIANAATILRHPHIVGDVHTVAEPFLRKAQQRPSCGRARVLIAAALEALWEYEDQLPELGRQFVQRAISEPHLPTDWRF